VTRLLVLTFLAAPCCDGGRALADQGEYDSTIGIRLLETPTNRAGDPRAQVYIVDHLAPGTTIKRRVSVTNSSLQPRHIEVFPGAASISDSTFNAMSDRSTNELTSWVSFDKAALDLQGAETSEVLVTIAVPRTGSEGEKYGVIWAETSAPSNTPDNVLMISRVGIRIYLDVGAGGESPSSFEIGSITPARTKDGQPEVLAAVRNTGGRALDMAGELSLSDGPGGVSAGPFPLAVGATLLPGQSSQVRILLDKRLPVGPWAARLTLRSGSIERTVTATITFPSADDTVGAPVTPDSWLEANLWWLIALLVALVLSFFVGRRLLARHRARAGSAAAIQGAE
jgi:hypothetical protein